MNRRAFLATAGAAGVAATAGCLASGAFDTTTSRAPPLVEPRPDSVYVPTHTESMGMVGTGAVGDLRVRVTYSYPHRFWTIERGSGDGYRAQQVEVGRDDAVHLMATPFDPETGQVIPDTGLSAEVYRDGELVTQEVIYRMLSQKMGFHYGANFPLEGDGSYELRISVAGVDLPRVGSFEGRFAEPGTATVAFDYSERDRNDLPYELLPDEQGRAGALAPMEMAGGRAPDLPGDALGAGTVDGARLLASRVLADRFGDDPYLAVSARTPHNGYVIPRMRLSAAAPDAGFGGRLAPALDPELGFHYGASVPDLDADASVTATVQVPSTVARHEGYETAFLETGTVDLTR